MLGSKKRIATSILSAYIVLVFLRSLLLKFTNSEETQNIFNTLDKWTAAEFGIKGLFLPPGMLNVYVIGSAECIASAFLFIGILMVKRVISFIGAFLALGVLSGAITLHFFTPLGIEVNDDGGLLFAMACGAWVAAILIMTINLDAIIKRLEMTPKTTAEA